MNHPVRQTCQLFAKVEQLLDPIKRFVANHGILSKGFAFGRTKSCLVAVHKGLVTMVRIALGIAFEVNKFAIA